MPLVGSCSTAISAACHRPRWEEAGAAFKMVGWGVVRDGGEGGWGNGRDEGMGMGGGEAVGHCAFSAEEVGRPVVGRYYAGRPLDWGGR